MPSVPFGPQRFPHDRTISDSEPEADGSSPPPSSPEYGGPHWSQENRQPNHEELEGNAAFHNVQADRTVSKRLPSPEVGEPRWSQEDRQPNHEELAGGTGFRDVRTPDQSPSLWIPSSPRDLADSPTRMSVSPGVGGGHGVWFNTICNILRIDHEYWETQGLTFSPVRPPCDGEPLVNIRKALRALLERTREVWETREDIGMGVNFGHREEGSLGGEGMALD